MSIMNLTLLITGGTNDLRKQKALEIASGSSSKFDITTLDANETNGINDIRRLRAKFSRRPFESTLQTFILLETQNLTLEAQNALLKSLEEPNPSTRFILTVPTAENLLSTISSRCQKIHLALEEGVGEVSNQLDNYLKMDFFNRYQKAAKLDIDLWIASYRSLLLGSFGLGQKSNLTKTERVKVFNYLKLASKLKTFLKRKASSRLVKSIVLLEAPQIINR